MNFLRFNNRLGKVYIVLNECLGTHRTQIICLLFHFIVINKFYEQIIENSLMVGKKNVLFSKVLRINVGMIFNYGNN